MRQDIVLVSNASMDLYPDNRLSNFRVRLPQPLAFDPSYKVAITRISFTKSYFNYDHRRGERKFWLILSDNRDRYEPDKESLSKCRIEGYPLSGYFTPATFVDMINVTAVDLLIAGTDQTMQAPKYSLKNGYLECRPGTFINAGGHEIKYELQFDPFTRALLGIENEGGEHKRPVFLNQGWTDLYVYSDLVYPSIVGDQSCELMCIVDGQTEKNYGSHCVEVFEDPWYHPLAKTNFQDIHVYIRNDSGAAPNFKFGRVCLRLSFRK